MCLNCLQCIPCFVFGLVFFWFFKMSSVFFPQGVVAGILAIVLSKNKKSKSLVSISAVCFLISISGE